MAKVTEEEIQVVEKVLSVILVDLDTVCAEKLAAIGLPLTLSLQLKAKDGWAIAHCDRDNLNISEVRYLLVNYPEVNPIIKDLADQIKATFIP